MFVGTIFIAVTFPDPWPPISPFIFLKKSSESGTLLVTADTAGRLTVQTISTSDGTTSMKFQPIKIEGGSMAIVAFIWSPSELGLMINDQDLMADPNGTMPPVAFSGCRIPTLKLLYPNLSPRPDLEQEEIFFLDTIRDIDTKTLAGSRYDLIRAAGLLRQLFLDEKSLVHIVNRKYKCKINFFVVEQHEKPPCNPELVWDSLGPYLPGAKTRPKTLDQFLAVPVLTFNSMTASVKDVIKACANAKGGVHYGSASVNSEELLLEFDGSIGWNNVEPSLQSLSNICLISLKGIEPIVRAILL